ncbi:serine threonine-protein kinase sgk2 [Paraphaeosphaeria sporulosa]
MDVGFVDDPHADVDASRRFVLGFTLCGSRMRLWEFDRLGGIASESFDIHEDGLQFMSAVLGFLWLNEEQLGFDPTIITDGDKQYIDIERNGCTERLIIDGVMKRTPCIAGRATTCWKAHREGSKVPLVIKESWQYLERDEEGELLREATEKEDDIRENVRRGLDVTNATNYRPESSMPPPSSNGRRISRTGRSSAAGTKRSSSCTDAPLPPSKRTCSSSPVKGGKASANRVHRRVILRDLGEPIYKASSPKVLLAALEDCIEGYESLQRKAGLLQSDISPNNLMVNEDKDNPSWPAFIIDLDLAIREQREKASGAHGKTGTRAFMAIGVLLDDENHSFMHDLESFFWVLFWICVHYSEAGKNIGPTEFECWNYESTEKLAELKKGLVSDERDFLKTAEGKFTDHYQPLIPCVNRLRRKVFPGGGRWRDPNLKLYDEMKEILKAARHDLEGSDAPREVA